MNDKSYLDMLHETMSNVSLVVPTDPESVFLRPQTHAPLNQEQRSMEPAPGDMSDPHEEEPRNGNASMHTVFDFASGGANCTAE